MSDQTLCYWIRGTPFHLWSEIKVPPSSTVLQLKTAIFELEKSNISCSPKELAVYKVPEDKTILNDDSEEELLKAFEITQIGQPLRAIQTLSSVFKGPILQGRLHLIVVDPTLVLRYWLRGTPFHLWREIKVPPSSTVLQLATAIFGLGNPNLSYSPEDLAVYKVPEDKPILGDDSEEELLKALDITQIGQPLRATQTLSSLFKGPIVRDRLHLIVDIPTLDVCCWLRGTARTDSFMVTASSFQTVDSLKSEIKKLVAHLASADNVSLYLYKISTQDSNIDEMLSTLGTGELIPGHHRLRDVFSDVPFSAIPCVVVEQRSRKIAKLPPSARRSVGDGDPIVNARKEFLTHARSGKPSAHGTPSSFRTRQRSQGFIPCGRRVPKPGTSEYYGEEETIPTTLLHPIFGQFVEDCQSIEVNAEDSWLAQDLEAVMSGLYDNEADRVNKVTDVFERHQIHFTVSKIRKTDYCLDVDMSVAGHRYVITEFKNETGNTSAEPYFEAISYYLESTRELATKHPTSCLPCLLLAIFGPYIVFAGAAWNLRPMAQILSTPIALHFHSSDTWNMHTVARHMAAFRKATMALKKHYEGLQRPYAATIPPSPAIQIFPYQTTYTSLIHKTTEKFRYEHEVVEQKLIFFATEENGNGERICVKFARTYSRDAHECFASLGCAPCLRGYETLPGGWLMIVFNALSEYETLYDRAARLPSAVFDDMSEKLTAFHASGFVHGDIRDVNIMVSKTDETKFMFVDFDWAGKIGEARYPPRVNTTTIRRPLGVIDGANITAEHDHLMLVSVRRSKCQD